MKRVLIYGDSLTWGRVPAKFERFGSDIRYTKVAQAELGTDYEIIEEGLRGRMLEGENPYFADRDGLEQFGPIFGSHAPLDLVVIFLGTNDANSKANKSTEEIVAGLDKYFELMDKWCQELQISKPKILIVAPPLIRGDSLKDTTMFEGAESKVGQLAEGYKKNAAAHGAKYLNAATVVQVSDEDGIHLDAKNNQKLGKVIATEIAAILNTT